MVSLTLAKPPGRSGSRPFTGTEVDDRIGQTIAHLFLNVNGHFISGIGEEAEIKYLEYLFGEIDAEGLRQWVFAVLIGYMHNAQL